jgi:hypothetical protein
MTKVSNKKVVEDVEDIEEKPIKTKKPKEIKEVVEEPKPKLRNKIIVDLGNEQTDSDSDESSEDEVIEKPKKKSNYVMTEARKLALEKGRKLAMEKKRLAKELQDEEKRK